MTRPALPAAQPVAAMQFVAHERPEAEKQIGLKQFTVELCYSS
jgi:hypothetical protein